MVTLTLTGLRSAPLKLTLATFQSSSLGGDLLLSSWAPANGGGGAADVSDDTSKCPDHFSSVNTGDPCCGQVIYGPWVYCR